MSAPIVKKSWFLGPASTGPIFSLWERYRSQLPPDRSFAEHRLETLIGGHCSKFPSDGLITDSDILSKIETNFKDINGRSLQKIISYDFHSRILVEVKASVPDASKIVQEGKQLLESTVPWCSELLNSMTAFIIPIYHEKFGRPFRRGFSHIDFLGTIFTSFVERQALPEELKRTVMAIDLNHELGHQILMLYQLADPIMTTDPNTPVYSSVRHTHRPAIMALQACAAAAYMMEVCRGIVNSTITTTLEKDFARDSIADLAIHQALSLNSLRSSVTFTIIGKRIFDELNGQLIAMKQFRKGSEQTRLNYFGLLAP